MGVIIFNGIPSTDYKIEVEYFPSYEFPTRDYEKIHVPGRNGDVYIDMDSYSNVSRSYDISFATLKDNQYTKMATGVSEWLHSTNGYVRLEDSYEPEYYRMAVYIEGSSFDNVLNHGGRSTINFDCKPQRFLKIGDQPIIFPSEVSRYFSLQEIEDGIKRFNKFIPYKAVFEEVQKEEEVLNGIKFHSEDRIVRTYSSKTDQIQALEEMIKQINSSLPFKIIFEEDLMTLIEDHRVLQDGATEFQKINALAQALTEIETSLPYIVVENESDGEKKAVFTDRSDMEIDPIRELTNPTRFTSLPIIDVYGSGTAVIVIGDYSILITEIGGHVTINSELQDVYDGSENKNLYVALPNGFPKLESGTTKIEFTGGITSLEVIPKWWTL